MDVTSHLMFWLEFRALMMTAEEAGSEDHYQNGMHHQQHLLGRVWWKKVHLQKRMRSQRTAQQHSINADQPCQVE
jgi:hypothetical protein